MLKYTNSCISHPKHAIDLRMASKAKLMQVFHSGSCLNNVVTVLLLVSFGFVLGTIYSANFPESYLPPFLQPLPSLALSSSSSHTTPPAPPPSPETPCILPPLPSPTPPLAPSSPSLPPEEPRMVFTDFLAPSGSVMHNMTDEELLWRASMAPKVAGMPRGIVPKVAFLFLTKGELPLLPLWEKFFAGHEGLYSIYIHASPDYAGSPPADSVFYGRMIPSQKTSWGNINLVEAERRLVANALLDLANTRFALVSESCIPLLSFKAIYSYLTTNSSSHVESYDRGDGRGRHNSFFTAHNITLSQWRKGAQWFEMDRALAVEFVAEHRYIAVFGGDHGASNMEEYYLATLVNLIGWGNCNTNRTLTYMDWRGGGKHPRDHGEKDVTVELVEGMRRGDGMCGYKVDVGGAIGEVEFCYLFARKFSRDAAGKLLELAPKVMGFG